MHLNDIKYALRHIIRYKEYSSLNIIGLALGMASAIVIMLWIEHEVRTDKFHANVDDIYIIRKMIDYSEGGTSIDISMTGPLAPVIEREIPEVKSAVRVTWRNPLLFRLDSKMFYEDGHYADSTFFQVFTFPLVLGSPETALLDPNSVVISQKLAEKYFGLDNPMGRTISIRNNREEVFTVTGVFEDVPTYSTLKFDFIIPYSKYHEYNSSWIGWGNFHMMTFIHTQPNTPVGVIDQKINEVYDRHGTWELPSFFVQPIKELHLYGDFRGSQHNPTGLILYIRIFSLVSLFIIFLACMNYTNMATAIATRRGREIGVKKVFGSARGNIFRQFTLEALSLTFIAFVLSLILVQIALPYFNQMIDTNLVLSFRNTNVLIIALMVPLLTGILAGIIPSFYMSAFKPIVVLKNMANSNKGLPQLRQTLVVFQFVITIAFILSSMVVFKQIKYIQSKTLGLDQENVIYFPQSLQISKYRNAFKRELETLPGVISVSYTSDSPLQVGSNTSDPRWRGKNQDFNLSVPYIRVDPDFCSTFKVDIIAGRDFRKDFPADTNSVIINETFAGIMGFDDPIGEIVDYWGRRANIIGVAKDFHIGNLRMPIQQLLMINRQSDTWLTMVRIDGSIRREAIRSIEQTFTAFDESVPFDYQFVDEENAKNYMAEKYLSRMSLLVTILTISISCLGLFGLALFTAEQRTKEIGIRKSIGARTSQVMLMLTLKFLGWVGVSFVIASALAYYLMRGWLQTFAYHTGLSWWLFILTGLIAMIIAIITVSWQAYRAANRNPVESLRYE